MRRPLPAPAALTIALALALALAGCGSGGSTTAAAPSAPTPAAPTPTAAAKAAARRAGRATGAGARQAAKAAKAAGAAAPKGASPTLRNIYRQFPAPVAGPGEGGAAAAIAAGERACAGKTPLEVKEEFYPAARRHLEAEQLKMIARIATYEAHDATDPSFVAGQLAADVYAATLEEEEAQGGYQGCVHSLARSLERRLAPEGK